MTSETQLPETQPFELLKLMTVIQSQKMASTVSNGNDRSEKWQRSSQMERSFQMATTVYEREIGIVDLQRFTSVAVL